MTSRLELFARLYWYFGFLSNNDISYELVEDYRCTFFDPINSLLILGYKKDEPKRTRQENVVLHVQQMVVFGLFSCFSFSN
jgi:hypothetical protein